MGWPPLHHLVQLDQSLVQPAICVKNTCQIVARVHKMRGPLQQVPQDRDAKVHLTVAGEWLFRFIEMEDMG